ncbi:MAG: hypothetical protein OXF22_09720 [Anaerolineaceae bacterium]|nr:hypothetical protein [Anaerolineaceae bacterium]
MTRISGTRSALLLAVTACLLLSALIASAATQLWRGQDWEYLMFGLAIDNEEIRLIPTLTQEMTNEEERSYIKALLLGDAELPQYLASLGERGWQFVQSERVLADAESVFAQLHIFTFKRPET